MSDFLVELGANAQARRLIKTLGLPLPMPQKLQRADGAWADKALAGKQVVVVPSSDAAVTAALADTLGAAGAIPFVEGDTLGTAWTEAGEAWGPRPQLVAAGEVPEGSLHAVVVDASSVASAADLKLLMNALQPRVKKLARSGRVVVIGRPHDKASSLAQAGARRALDGFVRALAREVGGIGVTSNLLVVEDGAEAAIEAPLRWLLTPYSAFLTSQVIQISKSVKAPGEIPWSQPLAGKVAVVTGAARGIGAATAASLAREGAKVVCLDLPMDAEQLAATARGIDGVALGLDVTAPDASARLLEALEPLGGLDVLVHNAGVTRDKTLARMDDKKWDLVMAVNLEALVDLTEGLSDAMNTHGRIIALSSVAGIAGNFGQTNYSASKAGVVGFVEHAAGQFRRRAITVNGIAPGFIETRLTAAIPAATREAGRRLSCLVQGGMPIDIAEAVTFLATPGAHGIHGRVIRVCGGAYIGA